ncbi:MAG: acyltransferase [Mucilaginibacter sp.]
MNKINFLPGLNSLRFVAATLVITGHAKEHLSELGISWYPDAEVFQQAGNAVKFFFVLSGFLLTMIAIRELEKTNTIHLRSFYLRRILRIFPLYYAVLIALIIINAGINPILLHKNTLGQPVVEGFLMNAFMLPNLAKAIWPETVGALGLLWSIGVEEQFYLFFPHLMKFLHKVKYKLIVLILVFACLFTFFRLVGADVIHFSPVWRKFITTLRFDYMLMGSIFSYLIFGTKTFGNSVLSVLNYKAVQLVIYVVALINIFFNIMPGGFVGGLVEPMFFSIIIISVSCTSNRLINFEIKPFSHWGAISYGMYLLHPFIAYALRFAFVKVDFVKHTFQTLPDLYPILLVLLTIALAHVSYTYYESRFLRLKDRLSKKIFN